MLRYAEQIGEDFSYVRVDLYEIAGQVKFGEVTFYPEAGLGVFNRRNSTKYLGHSGFEAYPGLCKSLGCIS